MFDLFKKKEDNSRTAVLDRAGAVQKQLRVKRPKTAPADFGKSFKFAENTLTPAAVRHSTDGELFFERNVNRSTKLLSQERFNHPQPHEPSSSKAVLTEELSPLPVRPTLGGPPVPNRSLSATSCEIRNPFRSDTSDTVTTISTSRTSSFAGAALPVQRTVPTWFPEQTEGTMDPRPHKAAIFTNPAAGLGITTDPFSDEGPGAEDSDLSTTPTTPTTPSSVHSTMQEQDMRTAQKRRRWSFLKSPKQSAQDFLQVHIPSGTLSPPMRPRHAFWSRA
ncbi:hypothetical protein L226DRAFT_530045 [Lentinus tigrinus ALCF2SS1-7]|uniref:Uncharacterized protein n=1 Tax=Lentinus tigrinus ALCF2SS1-6 TaxID=1328759 RepID=A0A5C2SS39_9APHY|nr:hypothetical protein L227DRAFT_648737 [Lentinus tigrinus ALCF2SS1-6]RPD79853.1 hypothetical protein L226DRAFT_530045 [Lentinus tigrinus ALCF2SS1-7]